VFVALVALALAGCLPGPIRVGNRPNVDLLETVLTVGKSTEENVVRVLGEPVYRSKAMLPIDAQPRTMWTYYYRESSLKDIRQFYLFVYFVEDRYDGYLWFSSFPK